MASLSVLEHDSKDYDSKDYYSHGPTTSAT